MQRRTTILILIAAAGSTAALSAPASEPVGEAAADGCGDLLATSGKKPPAARLVDCRYLPDQQGKPFRATYHGPGRDAEQVEAFLLRATGMIPLERLCCHWETRKTFFRDAAGVELSIVMASGETLAHDRSNWRDIPSFEIVVERYTEEI